MDKKESVGRAEHLLRTRTYSEYERNRIIDITNKQWGTIFCKSTGKFQNQCTYGQYGLTLRRWYEDVITKQEEDKYVV